MHPRDGRRVAVRLIRHAQIGANEQCGDGRRRTLHNRLPCTCVRTHRERAQIGILHVGDLTVRRQIGQVQLGRVDEWMHHVTTSTADLDASLLPVAAVRHQRRMIRAGSVRLMSRQRSHIQNDVRLCGGAGNVRAMHTCGLTLSV